MKTAIAILLLIPSLAFSAPLKEKFTDLPDPISNEAGKKLYQDNGCPVCHGVQGRGDGPLAEGLENKPRNFKDYDEMKRMPTIRMEQAIQNGLAGTAMPAFSHFSDAQVLVLTNYLRSFLVDSYSDLKMCAFQTYHINVKSLREPFHVEVDQPEKFSAKVRGKTISFSGKNWPDLLDRKSHRTHFRVMQDEHIVSLISVKIHRCRKEMNELLKSLPLQKAELN